tara:strand:+ start:56 stop:379 length:324 start_codon:yes stop_codon:yes gene_type:complete
MVVTHGSKVQVYNGTAKMTRGGLKKKDIMRIKDKYGNVRYKSKVQKAMGKKKTGKQRGRAEWTNAMKKARRELIREGVIESGEFVPVGGKTKEGKALLKRIKEIYYD